jgi:hypothetical protein
MLHVTLKLQSCKLAETVRGREDIDVSGLACWHERACKELQKARMFSVSCAGYVQGSDPNPVLRTCQA